MKRFYKKAEAGPAGNGYTVFLDGKPVRTPARAALVVPVPAVANAVAAEWDRQTDHVVPAKMPFMQYAATAIDRVATQREVVIDAVTAYGGTDLLCYRASYPERLVARQAAAWDPLLDWARRTHDIHLRVSQSVTPVPQDNAALARMRQLVARRSDLHLAAIHDIVGLTGSLVVTLAVLDRELTAEQTFEISELEESYVIEEWGEDAEAALRRKNNKYSLTAAIEFLNLCDS
jgi:chaperone required for assembly of F1-ATPase